MQKNGSFNREKSSNLAFMVVVSLCVLRSGGHAATADPFMPPESSPELSVGLHEPASCWASSPHRASLLSSGLTVCSWESCVQGLPCFSASPGGVGGAVWKGADLGSPLDKWEEPFKQPLALSFSEELFTEMAGLFWVGAVLELETGFTFMGRSSIPEATRFSMRPPNISIAPRERQ